MTQDNSVSLTNFDLEEIKQAFYNRFAHAGLVKFPNEFTGENEYDVRYMNAQWEMFVDFLNEVKGQSLKEDGNAPIFVFGSNTRGVHGRGAALFARRYRGAVFGVGFGHTGNSFAIPTKDDRIKTLPLTKIKPYVDEFIKYATEHPELKFEVTRIGCGLAGYTDADVGPMFAKCPPNCILPPQWTKFVEKS